MMYWSADELYLDLLRDTLVKGLPQESRGMRTIERTNVVVTLLDSRKSVVGLPSRRLNYPFMASEASWTWTGRNDVAGVSPYCREISKFSDDGVTFFGAYGPRIAEQVGHVVDSLCVDRQTRQAVLTIWRENPPPTRDVPCTCLMQFMIRGGGVHSTVYMRSSDAWLGVPYDVFNFVFVLRGITWLVNQKMRVLGEEERYGVGSTTLHLASSHLYERDLERAREVVGTESHRDLRGSPPPVNYWCDDYDVRDMYVTHGACSRPEVDDRWYRELATREQRHLYDRLYCVMHYRHHGDLDLLRGHSPGWADLVEGAKG